MAAHSYSYWETTIIGLVVEVGQEKAHSKTGALVTFLEGRLDNDIANLPMKQGTSAHPLTMTNHNGLIKRCDWYSGNGDYKSSSSSGRGACCAACNSCSY